LASTAASSFNNRKDYAGYPSSHVPLLLIATTNAQDSKHNPIILDLDFINTWVFPSDLERLAKSSQDDLIRKLAARAKKEDLYPVDSQVFSSKGDFSAGYWVQDALRCYQE
jgi:hypothetical protein